LNWIARLVVLVIVGVVASPPCRAEDADLAEAKRLYRAAEFETAVTRLHEVVATLSPRVQEARRDLADAYLYLGLSYTALGDENAARDAFRNLLAVEPGQHLDSAIYAPKVVELFEKARLSLPLSVKPEPRTEPRFSVELFGDMGSIGADRESPPGLVTIPTLADPGLQIGRLSFRENASSPGLKVSAGLPGRWGRLELSYRGFSKERLDTFLPVFPQPGFAYPEFPESRVTFASRRSVQMKSLDVTWSKPVKNKGVLVIRRELGYRFLSVDQTIDDLITVTNPDQTSGFAGDSHVRSHSVHFGYTLDVMLGRRFFVEGTGRAVFGLPPRVSGDSRTSYTGPLGPKALNGFRDEDWVWGGSDLALRFRWHVLGGEHGRGLHLSFGYQTEAGPYTRTDFGGSASRSGARVSLSWRFGPTGRR
jgi:hypothetical protein